MPTTVEDLLEAHKANLKAKREHERIGMVYDVENVPADAAMYESALKRLHQAADKVKKLMDDATPEVIQEARRLAKGR